MALDCPVLSRTGAPPGAQHWGEIHPGAVGACPARAALPRNSAAITGMDPGSGEAPRAGAESLHNLQPYLIYRARGQQFPLLGWMWDRPGTEQTSERFKQLPSEKNVPRFLLEKSRK